MKKKVLIVNPHFLPGFKSGGPQQTVKNICDVYGEIADIYLITLNHDFGEHDQYDVVTCQWVEKYGIKIKYLTDSQFGIREFWKAYNEFNTIYLCGLFCKSTYEIIIIHRMIKKQCVYVAPMGVFSKGAMAYKSFKKRLFLKFFNGMGLFDDIVFSFTSVGELTEAKQYIREKKYIIAEDLPRKVDFAKRKNSIKAKDDNVLKIVFLSRISRIKNLDYALRILQSDIQGNIELVIAGIIEDQDYWNQCLTIINDMPQNVSVKYVGEIHPDKVIDFFSAYDVFLFPTKGENFGHVIYESLAAGCIPVISDTTPWKDLDEKKCGNVIEYNSVAGFRDAINFYSMCSNKQLMLYKRKAIEYAEEKYGSSIENNGYSSVFEE